MQQRSRKDTIQSETTQSSILSTVLYRTTHSLLIAPYSSSLLSILLPLRLQSTSRLFISYTLSPSLTNLGLLFSISCSSFSSSHLTARAVVCPPKARPRPFAASTLSSLSAEPELLLSGSGSRHLLIAGCRLVSGGSGGGGLSLSLDSVPESLLSSSEGVEEGLSRLSRKGQLPPDRSGSDGGLEQCVQQCPRQL